MATAILHHNIADYQLIPLNVFKCIEYKIFIRNLQCDSLFAYIKSVMILFICVFTRQGKPHLKAFSNFIIPIKNLKFAYFKRRNGAQKISVFQKSIYFEVNLCVPLAGRSCKPVISRAWESEPCLPTSWIYYICFNLCTGIWDNALSFLI